MTLVPRAAADSLGLSPDPHKQYQLMGFGGGVSFAPVVRLELVFCARTFRGQFLVVEQEWGVMGRNVLNAISLTLDGPRLAWQEHRPA